MKLLIPILLFSFTQVHAQKSEIVNWVNLIDSLKTTEVLTIKDYPSKTFVGSLTGYFLNNSLVLIVSLKDGEYGGTESRYYIKDKKLKYVAVISAEFIDYTEWNAYYSNHLKNMNCISCHGTPNCEVMEIVFLKDPIVEYKSKNDSRLEMNKNEIIKHLNQTYEQMVKMLEEI